MAKIIIQHLVGIADNSTGGSGGLNNPVGLLSFDAGFMNTEPTFGQRSSEAGGGGGAGGSLQGPRIVDACHAPLQ